MPEIPIADRLAALGLDRIPESDHDDLQRVVRSLDEAASRIRATCSYADEPSNVFRLVPARSPATGAGGVP